MPQPNASETAANIAILPTANSRHDPTFIIHSEVPGTLHLTICPRGPAL